MTEQAKILLARDEYDRLRQILVAVRPLMVKDDVNRRLIDKVWFAHAEVADATR